MQDFMLKDILFHDLRLNLICFCKRKGIVFREKMLGKKKVLIVNLQELKKILALMKKNYNPSYHALFNRSAYVVIMKELEIIIKTKENECLIK